MLGFSLNYFVNIGISILIFLVTAQSYNLIMGYTGLFHLGHVAFVAIGAYTMAILSTVLGWSFGAALLGTVVICGLAGLIVGVPTLRLREDYLVVATLGFGLIVHKFAENLVDLTGGPYGIDGIPRPEILGFSLIDNSAFFIFLLVMVFLVQVLIYRIVKSGYGKVLEAVREDEIAVQAIGINAYKYKLQVLVLGAVFAGIAGGFAGQYYSIISPRSYQLIEMVYILIMVVIGGNGSFWGAIFGAIFVNVVIEVFRFMPFPDSKLGALRVIFFAFTLIVLMIFRPQGLMGKKVVGRKY